MRAIVCFVRLAQYPVVERLRDVDVGEDDLPAMATKATVMGFLLDNNPRDMTEADILEIYRAAY